MTITKEVVHQTVARLLEGTSNSPYVNGETVQGNLNGSYNSSWEGTFSNFFYTFLELNGKWHVEIECENSNGMEQSCSPVPIEKPYEIFQSLNKAIEEIKHQLDWI